MTPLSSATIFRYLIYAVFIALISISPSLKVIPEAFAALSLHDCQRLVELVLIGFILLESIRNGHCPMPLNNTITIRYLIYSLVILIGLSSYNALSPRHAFIESSLYLGLWYLAMTVARVYTENSTRFLIRFSYLVWGGVVLSIVAFYVGYFTAAIFKTPVIWPGPITGFNNIRFFNQYQLWTLGILLLPLLAFDIKNIFTRFWMHLVVILWWVMLFHSASRGVLLSWAIGLVIIAALYRKIAFPFIRLQLLHISLGFLSYLVLFKLIPSLRGAAVVTGTILRETTSDRIVLWRQALDLIQQHPVLGVGPMHFAWFSPVSAHPHNSVLQIMAEWGLPAALLLFTLVFYGLFCWLKSFNAKRLASKAPIERHWVVILVFTLFTNAVYSLVDGVIVMPISQVMLFTCIGLMIAFYKSEYGSPISVNFKTASANRLFAIILLTTLIGTTLPEIMQNAAGSDKRFSFGYTAQGPRFWLEFKD